MNAYLYECIPDEEDTAHLLERLPAGIAILKLDVPEILSHDHLAQYLRHTMGVMTCYYSSPDFGDPDDDYESPDPRIAAIFQNYKLGFVETDDITGYTVDDLFVITSKDFDLFAAFQVQAVPQA